MEENNDEVNIIDIKNLLNVFVRNKLLIAKITIVFFLGSVLYNFIQKPTYKGDFQIVLQSKGSSSKLGLNKINSLASSNSLFSNVVGGLNSNLKTEVVILQSPSVLMNVFKYVKSKKLESGKDVEKWRYTDWLKYNLVIELQRGTSVLNITYKDKDKELIEDVLFQISNTYQLYSGKDRKKSIETSLDYLKKQIENYKVKSNNSLKEFSEFAYKNKLVSKSNNQFNLNKTNLFRQTPSTSQNTEIFTEVERLKAANQIQIINKSLEKLNSIKENGEDLIGFALSQELASQNRGTVSLQNTIKSIKEVNNQIVITEINFKPDDESLKLLNNQKKSLIKLLKEELKAILNGAKLNQESLLEANTRPEKVLVKYRQLLRDSKKDESTLNNLESEYRLLALEQSKIKDPWELITKPTINDDPIYPEKLKNILLYGLFFGAFISYFVAYLLEIRTGKIYSLDKILSLLKYPVLLKLYKNEKDSWQKKLNLFSESKILASQKKSSLIYLVGEFDEKFLNDVETFFEISFKNKNYIISNKIEDIKKYDVIIILTSIGVAKEKDLLETIERFKILEQPLEGLILINI